MPPFSRLVKIVMMGSAEKEVARQILSLARLFEAGMEKSRFQLLGPAPCLISKRQGRFFWNLYIKGPSVEEINPVIENVLGQFKKMKVLLTIDVDPQ